MNLKKFIKSEDFRTLMSALALIPAIALWGIWEANQGLTIQSSEMQLTLQQDLKQKQQGEIILIARQSFQASQQIELPLLNRDR